MRTTTTASQSKVFGFPSSNQPLHEHGVRMNAGVRIGREVQKPGSHSTSQSSHCVHIDRSGVRISSREGVRISGQRGVRISGQQGVRISGQQGVRISAASARRLCAA